MQQGTPVAQVSTMPCSLFPLLLNVKSVCGPDWPVGGMQPGLFVEGALGCEPGWDGDVTCPVAHANDWPLFSHFYLNFSLPELCSDGIQPCSGRMLGWF